MASNFTRASAPAGALHALISAASSEGDSASTLLCPPRGASIPASGSGVRPSSLSAAPGVSPSRASHLENCRTAAYRALAVPGLAPAA